MTKEELIARLEHINLRRAGDPELAHIEADDALLAYIGDHDISEAFMLVPRCRP